MENEFHLTFLLNDLEIEQAKENMFSLTVIESKWTI